MTRTVYCQVLKQEAEGLDRPPHPGSLGKRVYDNISKEGWKQWLQRLTTIINENQPSTADPKSIGLIEQHLVGFLFGEGTWARRPRGFRPLDRRSNSPHWREMVMARDLADL